MATHPRLKAEVCKFHQKKKKRNRFAGEYNFVQEELGKEWPSVS